MIESIITPEGAEKHPRNMFLLGLVYAFLAALLSLWVFRQYASVLTVFLIVMASIPVVYGVLKIEEKKDEQGLSEKRLLKEHSKVISLFSFLFLGVLVSLTLLYVLMPSDTVDDLFEAQTQTITSINSKITGAFDQGVETFLKIFFNNLRVLVLCILFSALYGAGALFILSWNASVIAVAIGNFIRSGLSSIAGTAGSSGAAAYFNIISLALLRYMVHGIPEIIAYFVAALAGGIISVAVIRHNFHHHNFQKILLDSVDLVLISTTLLFIAALLEVYVTPLLF